MLQPNLKIQISDNEEGNKTRIRKVEKHVANVILVLIF